MATLYSSGASTPDATESTAGKLRIATNAEATAGTNDTTAMTPLKVAAAISASSGSVTGALVYRGSYDASTASPDLTTASKGDFYIVSVAGALDGVALSVGDHVVFNQNASSPVTSAMFDVIDNTDAVASVNGQTGVITLTASDVGALATGDNVSALTNDAGYLTSAPVTSVNTQTGAVTLTASDVGALATGDNISELTNDSGYLTSTLSASITVDTDGAYDLGTESARFDKIFANLDGAVCFKASNASGAQITKGQPVYINGLSGDVPTVALADADAAAMPSAGLAGETANAGAEIRIITFGNLTDVDTSSFSLGDTLYIDTTAGALTATPPAGEAAKLQNIGKVIRVHATSGVIKVGGAGRSAATPNLDQDKIFLGDSNNRAVSTALSAINLSKFNNDLSGLGNQINALQVKTGASYTAQANYVYIGGYSSGTQTITMPAASGATSGDIIGFTSNVASRALSLVSSDGTTNDIINQSNQAKGGSNGALSLTVNQQISWFIHNGTSWYEANAAPSAVTTSGAYSDLSGTPTLATVATTGAYSDLSGTPTLATVATTGAYSDLSGTPTLATVATTGAYSDLSGTPTLGTAAAQDVGTSASNVVQLDGSARLPAVDGSQLTNLPSGATQLNELSDVTITGASTGEVLRYSGAAWVDAQLAYSDLSGTPTLATVATTGAYSDLSGTPTLGTAAALDVGTSANNVVQLDGSARLPAVDGSQLTNLPGGGLTYSAITADPANAQAGYHYSCTGTFTITLATSGYSAGEQIRIKNMGTGTITIDPQTTTIDGSTTDYTLDVQYSALTLVSTGTNWEII